jgi:hypothetical protein
VVISEPSAWIATTPLLAGRGMRTAAAAGHGGSMKPTQALYEAGQSLWLDNITRALFDEGILARYVDEYSVTGLTYPAGPPTTAGPALSR